MLKDRPSVNQLKKRYGTTGFFLTTLLPNRIKCVAIKQEYVGKKMLTDMRKHWCVIPDKYGYYNIINK